MEKISYVSVFNTEPEVLQAYNFSPKLLWWTVRFVTENSKPA
jgi:hypothetical protein